MASTLDRRVATAITEITGPGGILQTAGTAGATTVETLPQTLAGFFDQVCAANADATAIVAGTERLTFGEVHALATRLAAALAGGHGVRRGDPVGIAMRNCPAWIVAFIAIAKAGGIVTLVNSWWQADELGHALALVEPALILADPERAARIAAGGATARVATIAIELPAADALAPLIDGVPTAPLPAIRPDDDATILFTSGSTGRAKGAVSTQRAVVTGTCSFLSLTLAALALLTEDTGKPPDYPPAILVAVPLFHVTGMVPVLLNSFAIGRKLVLMRKWDAGHALALIAQERVTYFIGVPTMSLEMMQHPDRERHDLASLADIAAGGAARPVAHVARLKAAFPDGSPLLGYGLTETNAVGCTNIRQNYLDKPASTGRAQAPFVAIAILDDDGRALPQGATGEIGIASAALFRGYWNDPAASAQAMAGEYFRTGDIGYLDADGYLFIVDRAKDIIIRGGENISCLEVEAAIYAQPSVAEASVFGLPDDRLGEVPAAVVRAKDGTSIDPNALHGVLERALARFKVPDRIWVSETPLPKLGTGKIDKGRLRTAYRALAEVADSG